MNIAHTSRSAFSSDGWFPAELSRHLPPGHVVQSMLHGQELALWRSSVGTVQAWENRCPHRSVRLTLGFVANDQLVCRYHGWRYGQDGRCAGVPSTPALAPPPAACVRTYLCREADGVIWVSLALMPRGYPPKLPALDACRSFIVEVPADALVRSIADAGFEPGANPAVWREPGACAEAATLLLQPMAVGTTNLHLFIPVGVDTAIRATRRLATSQRLKSLLTQWGEVTAELHHVQ